MKIKPEIINELIELEKNGKLMIHSNSTFNQILDHKLENQKNEKIKTLNNNTKTIKKEDYLENINKKYFKDIFDSTSDFLIYIEKDTIVDINKTALKSIGISKENIVGKSLKILKNIFLDEDLNKLLNIIDSVISGQKKTDQEFNLHINNKICIFLFSFDSINEQEEKIGILIRGKDITQHQKSWEELVKLEERYRILAETSADGVITIDPLGRLTYINPSFEKMCLRDNNQILLTSFINYLSNDSVYLFQQLFIDVRKKNEKIENIELELIHPNGNIIPIELNLAPFYKKNEFISLVCTIRDITERKRIQDEIKKSERLKTEFMNIAAHELKSPITPIKGYLDLIISDKNSNLQIKNWAKISLRNTERLLNIINDILDVSRLDNDSMRFEMIKLNIVELLVEIVEDMRISIEKKNLKFNVEIPTNLPNIIGDKNRLSQVLKNLIINSIKFTDKGSITIKAEIKDEDLIIYIIDTGIGISQENLKKIFNKFYQVYTENDRKNEGLGLGLFICKEIIKKHNGEIGVESQLNIGSKFFIKLKYLKS